MADMVNDVDTDLHLIGMQFPTKEGMLLLDVTLLASPDFPWLPFQPALTYRLHERFLSSKLMTTAHGAKAQVHDAPYVCPSKDG